MNSKPNKFDMVLGMSVIACLTTGIASLLTALFAFYNSNWTGTGICLGAAAIAFGLLTNAIINH
jgi:hypothetical protein